MLKTAELMEKIKKEKPLVHHITNWVTIYDCANITRSVGALPVMAHAKEEVEEMVSLSDALVLNIGTLTPQLIEAMVLAGKKANQNNIPVVLDAVGVGATALRTDKAVHLLNEIKFSVIKGNASEVAKLAGAEAQTKGVEAGQVEGKLVELAKKLAKEKNATVVITGAEDIVTDGSKTFLVKNGHGMMGKIVGTGCMAASVIGAFNAVEADAAQAAASALSAFGIAGELAAKEAKGPGTYKEAFYDELFNLDQKKVEEMEKVEQIE